VKISKNNKTLCFKSSLLFSQSDIHSNDLLLLGKNKNAAKLIILHNFEYSLKFMPSEQFSYIHQDHSSYIKCLVPSNVVLIPNMYIMTMGLSLMIITC